MAKHIISVCIFCFICATHSPCASHAAVGGENVHHHDHNHHQQPYNDPNNPPLVETVQFTAREKFKHSPPLSAAAHFDDKTPPPILHNNNDRISNNNINNANRIIKLRSKRLSDSSSDNSDKSNFIKKDEDNVRSRESYLREIFLKYGDGESMTMEGFERLMKRLNLMQALQEKSIDHIADLGQNASETHNDTCIKDKQIKSLVEHKSSKIDYDTFAETCPYMLYNLIVGRCAQNEFHVHDEDGTTKFDNTSVYVWVFSLTAVFIISACGVLSLVIIPVMQNRFYKPLIQFLVALAVGTLAGDALLHLLPHAMSTTSQGHHHAVSVHEMEHSNHQHSHDENMWKGFVAMWGLVFFFTMEKVIMIAGKWRKGKQKHKHHKRIKVVNESNPTHTNDTKCMDKYSSYPYCYKDIIDDPNTQYLESDRTGTTSIELDSNSDIQSFKKSRSPTIEKLEANQNMTECSSNLVKNCSEVNKMLPSVEKHHGSVDYTVILREHETNHHGHSHTHGHVHAAPRNLSSVAWMVIMGDGLHNFTDGMAIGAAFSGGLAGGFSTAVAVFCHELPHELGDFAMLLKAGMSIKQALFYNLLSSILCVVGNIFGVWLGNTDYASSWVFAAAAGMFLYIALVDMIPELSSGHEDEGNFVQCLLHFSGLHVGFAIMTVIALYEHDLKSLFNDPM